MFAEVMTGIALVKSATDFIKQNLDTAQSISDIAKSVDDLLTGEEQCQKLRAKKGSKQTIKDQFSIESVAQEIIDAKLAQERLNEISTLIDLRFGHGTFASIKAERKKRIDEAKKIAEMEEKQRRAEMKQFTSDLKLGFSVFLAIAGILGILVLMIMFA
jgi:hypothetical protein